MAFIEIHADLKALVAVATRIADALDRAFPKPVKAQPNSIGLERLSHVDEEKLWQIQNEDQTPVARGE